MTWLDKWGPPIESGAGVFALGLLTRLIARLRHRKRFGKAEDEALVTEIVERAVKTQGEVLDDLREEREDDRQRIAAQQTTINSQWQRIDGLTERVGALEAQIVALHRQLGARTAELAAAHVALHRAGITLEPLPEEE